MTGGHVVVARYDMLALDVLDSGCIFVGDDVERLRARRDADAGAVAPTPTEPARSRRADGAPTPEPTPVGTRRCPTSSIPPWDGKERLNILLIGATSGRARAYNTDTLIVVSIDPVTKQVAMFSLPRDTVDVPLPPGPARQAFGPRLRAEDQRLVHVGPQPRRTSSRATKRDPRLQRPQGDPRQPLRARHQVLRRGQLRRLQDRSSTRSAA